MARTVKDHDIRRQELLDIGVRLFLESGEKGISIQEVVRQADVAIGLFYYYFKSKDEFLDEALNDYVNHEIISFEVILNNSTLSACEKLDAVLGAFFSYAKKMAPMRSCGPFHTERHYALTEKLVTRLKSKVVLLLQQGILENTFDVGDVYMTAGFILNGLASVFDASTDISEVSLEEMKRLVYKVLKGQHNEDND